jgi:hypothetical protein
LWLLDEAHFLSNWPLPELDDAPFYELDGFSMLTDYPQEAEQQESLENAALVEGSFSRPEDATGGHLTIPQEYPDELSLQQSNSDASAQITTTLNSQSENEAGLSSSSGASPITADNMHYCYKCNPPRAIQKKYQLTAHQRRHDPRFVCDQPECNKRFQYRKDLARHTKTIHTKHDQLIERFPCPHLSCEWSFNGKQKGFSRPDTLRRHLRTIHKVSSPSSASVNA